MTNTETVQFIYERFAQSDAAAILGTFADNIEFRLAEGHPYQPSGDPWFGREAIITHFFKRGNGEWQDWKMNVHDIISSDDALLVEGRYTGLYIPTGKAMDVQVCHVWRFTDGKVSSFHQYLDSAKLQDAMRAG